MARHAPRKRTNVAAGDLPPTSRRDARERALELLYEASMKTASMADVLADLPVPPDAYTQLIVVGVDAHQNDHDALIKELLRKDWTFNRLPLLDRLLLRMGCEELAHQPGTPTAVILDQTVELAKQFSTPDSGAFVNGVLANAVARLRPTEGSARR